GAAGSRFNFDAWTPAAPYTFGNAPVLDGNIRDFPFYQEDISIIKRTNITERVSVEFRADFLNAFNRVLFGFDQGGDQHGQISENRFVGTTVENRLAERSQIPAGSEGPELLTFSDPGRLVFLESFSDDLFMARWPVDLDLLNSLGVA